MRKAPAASADYSFEAFSNYCSKHLRSYDYDMKQVLNAYLAQYPGHAQAFVQDYTANRANFLMLSTRLRPLHSDVNLFDALDASVKDRQHQDAAPPQMQAEAPPTTVADVDWKSRIHGTEIQRD